MTLTYRQTRRRSAAAAALPASKGSRLQRPAHAAGEVGSRKLAQAARTPCGGTHNHQVTAS